MEHKEFLIEELKAEDDTRKVSGYGSVFSNVDQGGDIVMPGAFVKSLKKRTPKMLWQHSTDKIPGKWDLFEERDRGLYMEGRFARTPLGDEAYELAKMGALDGLSIGFSINGKNGSEVDGKTGNRRIKDLTLYEVSLVTFPMNEKSTITHVKSMPTTLREFEEFLREEGKFSREDATTIAMRGYKALESGREAQDEEHKELAELLGRFTQQFTL